MLIFHVAQTRELVGAPHGGELSSIPLWLPPRHPLAAPGSGGLPVAGLRYVQMLSKARFWRSNHGVKSTTMWVNSHHILIVSERFGEQLLGFGDAQLAGEEFGEELISKRRQ